MPILSIDWPEVKSRLPGDTCLFALTDRQAAILLSLSEQLTWEKTWRVDGYEFDDKQTLDIEIADLQAQLAMPVQLQSIIQHIDEIEDLLKLLQNPPGCCNEIDWTGGDGYTIPIDENSQNGVPQHLVDSGFATDVDDWDGFTDFQCQVANVLVNNLQSKVVSLEDVFDAAGVFLIAAAALVGLIGLVFASGASLLFAGILASSSAATRLWTALNDGGVDAVPTPEEIQLSREALVCAWMDDANDGVDDRITAYHDAIDAEFNVAEALILKALQPAEWLKALYTGQYTKDEVDHSLAQKMVDQGIGPGTYDCSSCNPEPGYDPTNYLMDGGFEETALPGPHWKHGPNPEGYAVAEAAYTGSKGWKGSKGAGWPDEYYTYQEFTIDRSGNMQVIYDSKHYQGSYNSFVRMERWTGAAWVTVGSANFLVPPWDGQWHTMTDQSVGAVTAGQQFRIRLGLGYNYFDNVKVQVDWAGPG